MNLSYCNTLNFEITHWAWCYSQVTLGILAPLSWEGGTQKWFLDYQEAFPTELIVKDSLLFFPIKEFPLARAVW